MCEEVQRDAADEAERWDNFQRLGGVVQCGLGAEGEQHDPSDHGEMEVGVDVAGERSSACASCLGESRFGGVEYPVEVRPPKAGEDGDPEEYCRDEFGVEFAPGDSDADANDRFSERDE